MKTYLLTQLATVALGLYILVTTTGCMQLTGAKRITMGTWSIESNSGFEVAAGVQQFDHVLDKRGYNVEQRRAE